MVQAKEVCEGKETFKSRLFPQCWFYNPEISFTTACILKKSGPHRGGEERKYCIYPANSRVRGRLLTLCGHSEKELHYWFDRYYSFEFLNFNWSLCFYFFPLCVLKADVIFWPWLTAYDSHLCRGLFLLCNSAHNICRLLNSLTTDVETMTYVALITLTWHLSLYLHQRWSVSYSVGEKLFCREKR